ncbi:hypothetical protein BCR39DRAFT_508153 [Naematelia encephala]|uniref:Uncharacterized protein n=1 Tax=Naematelia encephala TaxID=71784 RepID=A0A1Y2AIC3_9TREE|nr:hypothetical protein BCR39DRAFT_508153 [Naematelia encephala]
MPRNAPSTSEQDIAAATALVQSALRKIQAGDGRPTNDSLDALMRSVGAMRMENDRRIAAEHEEKERKLSEAVAEADRKLADLELKQEELKALLVTEKKRTKALREAEQSAIAQQIVNLEKRKREIGQDVDDRADSRQLIEDREHNEIRRRSKENFPILRHLAEELAQYLPRTLVVTSRRSSETCVRSGFALDDLP